MLIITRAALSSSPSRTLFLDALLISSTYIRRHLLVRVFIGDVGDIPGTARRAANHRPAPTRTHLLARFAAWWEVQIVSQLFLTGPRGT